MSDKFESAKKRLGLKGNDLDASKSIIIDSVLHKQYKDYCRFNKRKIGGQTEDMIRLYLSNPNEIQILIDSLKNKEVHA